MTFEKFVEFYKKNGKCINSIYFPKKPLTKEQLKQKYENLLKQFEKNKQKKIESKEKRENRIVENAKKGDPEWEETRRIVFERDGGKCQLLKFLIDCGQYDTARELRESANSFVKITDPAHIYPRSTCPQLKYDLDNVVCLNRFSHSMLDTYRDPINGKDIIDIEQRLLYFQLMVGSERIERLKEKIRSGKG